MSRSSAPGCLTTLGDHQQAAQLFHDAIADIPPSLRRDRGVYIAREAMAHANANDPEQAADVGLRALAIAQITHSGRITTELRRLDTALRRWKTVPRASEFHPTRSAAPSSSKRARAAGSAGEGPERKAGHAMAAPRPYVLLSCAMSVDGYIDDTTSERLRLSDEEDFDRVDQVRAESDAILIGATTLRRDNPRLIVKSRQRQGRERGVRQLMVKGGTTIHTQFLTPTSPTKSTSPSRRSSSAPGRATVRAPGDSPMATAGVCISRSCGR